MERKGMVTRADVMHPPTSDKCLGHGDEREKAEGSLRWNCCERRWNGEGTEKELQRRNPRNCRPYKANFFVNLRPDGLFFLLSLMLRSLEVLPAHWTSQRTRLNEARSRKCARGSS